jgi:cytochrome b6-f complex iron-sulfur subunit
VGHTEETRTDSPTRREFCLHTCQAASLLTLAAFAQACGSPTASDSISAPPLPTVSGSVVTGGVTVATGGSSPLAAVGSAALVQSSAGNFLVSRSSATSFVALTAVCTHQGCTVSDFENQNYVCPCHGSRYSLNGSVVQGPAPSSLRQFTTDFANDVLTIHT